MKYGAGKCVDKLLKSKASLCDEELIKKQRKEFQHHAQ